MSELLRPKKSRRHVASPSASSAPTDMSRGSIELRQWEQYLAGLSCEKEATIAALQEQLPCEQEQLEEIRNWSREVTKCQSDVAAGKQTSSIFVSPEVWPDVPEHQARQRTKPWHLLRNRKACSMQQSHPSEPSASAGVRGHTAEVQHLLERYRAGEPRRSGLAKSHV